MMVCILLIDRVFLWIFVSCIIDMFVIRIFFVVDGV